MPPAGGGGGGGGAGAETLAFLPCGSSSCAAPVVELSSFRARFKFAGLSDAEILSLLFPPVTLERSPLPASLGESTCISSAAVWVEPCPFR